MTTLEEHENERINNSKSYKDKSFFVGLEFIVPLDNFSLIWRRHHTRWKAVNVDLCSALMAIEHWGFFSVQHLLWHGAPVYNFHLRGPMELGSIAESLAVEPSLPNFTIFTMFEPITSPHNNRGTNLSKVKCVALIEQNVMNVKNKINWELCCFEYLLVKNGKALKYIGWIHMYIHVYMHLLKHLY